MLDFSKLPDVGERIGARLMFYRQELHRGGDSYVHHAIRQSAMGVVDAIAVKYTKRIVAEDGELMGVEYELRATVLSKVDMDELIRAAYRCGLEDATRFGPVYTERSP